MSTKWMQFLTFLGFYLFGSTIISMITRHEHATSTEFAIRILLLIVASALLAWTLTPKK